MECPLQAFPDCGEDGTTDQEGQALGTTSTPARKSWRTRLQPVTPRCLSELQHVDQRAGSQIATSYSFAVKFTQLNQSVGETVGEYAAELKHLYCKAYTHRDRETRREGLLRRFVEFTGLKTRWPDSTSNL